MMDAKPLLDQLRGLGVDLGGLDTIGSESAQSESSISYGPELVEDFELAWVQYRDRTEALEQMRRFETEILGPIRDKMPDLAASLVAIISNELQSGKGDVDGVFRNLRKQVQHDWLLQANSLDSAALARSDTWSALLQGTANLQHLSQQLAYLQNYELMEAELFTRETANIENAVQQVNAKLANARSKFPDEVFLDQETATEIDEVTASASKWPEMARHRRNYESVQAATFKAVSRLELIEKQIDSQLGRLIDPSLWLVDKEPQVDSMKDGGLRQKLASLLTSLQVKYSALADNSLSLSAILSTSVFFLDTKTAPSTSPST
jgi:hypothetical protein